jgi:hypothetical protein
MTPSQFVAALVSRGVVNARLEDIGCGGSHPVCTTIQGFVIDVGHESDDPCIPDPDEVMQDRLNIAIQDAEGNEPLAIYPDVTVNHALDLIVRLASGKRVSALAGQFDPDEVEALIRTAAEAVNYCDVSEFASQRQVTVALRAWAIMSEEGWQS